MYLAKIGISALLVSAIGVSGCTTVDLSQVSQAPEMPAVTLQNTQNIVQRTSQSLVADFKDKGWAGAGPREQTQTAASILLNGYNKDVREVAEVYKPTTAGLEADLEFAALRAKRASAAATLYIDMLEPGKSVDAELSDLEAALAAARSGNGKFVDAARRLGWPEGQSTLERYQQSMLALQTVTNQFGDVARSHIASQAGVAVN